MSAYDHPTDDDLAVWLFEGQGYQVPVWDDHILKLGTAYDWRADTTSGGTDVATAVGGVTRATVAAEADSFWLKDQQAPANNLKLPVRYDAGIPMSIPRRAQTLDPLAGDRQLILYGEKRYGYSIALALIFSDAAQLAAVEAALARFLSLDTPVYYQDRGGRLCKVRFPQGIAFTYQDYGVLEAEINLTEVA